MDSNKSTTIGILLILLVFFGWMMLNKPTPPPTTVKKDSTTAVTGTPGTSGQPTAPATSSSVSAIPPANQSAVFTSDSAVPMASKKIETPLYSAEIGSKGASLTHFVLKSYKTWNGKPVDLMNQQHQNGDVNLRFVASDGKVASTKDLPFRLDGAPVTLANGDSVIVTATYQLDSGRSIQKTFVFRGNEYLMNVSFTLRGLQQAIAGFHYNAVVENSLPYAEEHSATESASAHAFAGAGEDIEKIDVADPSEPQKKAFNGPFNYVGSRSRYFTQALIADAPKTTGADLSGVADKAADGGHVERYEAGLTVPANHAAEEHLAFKYYLGPLEYSRIEGLNLGLEQTMDFGWSFLVRPISIHLLLPLFMFLHKFFSNWGVVIIVFSLLIKLVTLPLTNKQMKSMRKMQALNPKVVEVREKYKDDAQKMNQELLGLYRMYGVNPAGGCLPLLLQMPILFALYAVLSNVIELRQAPFALWITDLSSPDVLINFGTNLPLIGAHLSGLTLLLTATTFIQQLFTVTDPRQKSMAYIMSLVFIFMFNSLPSGVGLYYFVFNIVGLVQQIYLMKFAPKLDIESMKVDPKKAAKGGGFMAKLQSIEQQAREQKAAQSNGKALPQKGQGKKKK
jgi:YidC/Oxa1 family membrane protein insertase